MRNLVGVRIGCAMTGSFCTFREAFEAWRALAAAGAELFPIMSANAYGLDTRFFPAAEAALAGQQLQPVLLAAKGI